ncbi:hypothetical protein DdX_13092 [Ditylenchus destructor]|uniref:Uncharacterized protein n=1 Tax=Ditylenchus destructor TaxID=166010 RepID=A0AAD4MUD4_9BILA|nr:hypothetical protein DdX_13092 [Ditylenchus destructor]
MFNRNGLYGFVMFLMAGVYVNSIPIAFSIPDEGALLMILCCAGKYPPNNASNTRPYNDCVASVGNMYAHSKGSTMYESGLSQLKRKFGDSPSCFQRNESNPIQKEESKTEGQGCSLRHFKVECGPAVGIDEAGFAGFIDRPTRRLRLLAPVEKQKIKQRTYLNYLSLTLDIKVMLKPKLIIMQPCFESLS